MNLAVLLLFSRSVVSDFLQPYGLQHSRLPCPSPSPRVCSNSCPLSVVLSNHLILCHSLLSCPQSFPVSPSVQSLSPVQLFVTPWTAARKTSLSFTISQSLQKHMSIELVMPSNHLILWCPLFLLPSIFPSMKVFSKELALCIRWPKYWSFSNSPSNEYLGLISFKIDWFDFLEVQGTLKSLL